MDKNHLDISKDYSQIIIENMLNKILIIWDINKISNKLIEDLNTGIYTMLNYIDPNDWTNYNDYNLLYLIPTRNYNLCKTVIYNIDGFELVMTH